MFTSEYFDDLDSTWFDYVKYVIKSIGFKLLIESNCHSDHRGDYYHMEYTASKEDGYNFTNHNWYQKFEQDAFRYHVGSRTERSKYVIRLSKYPIHAKFMVLAYSDHVNVYLTVTYKDCQDENVETIKFSVGNIQNMFGDFKSVNRQLKIEDII